MAAFSAVERGDVANCRVWDIGNVQHHHIHRNDADDRGRVAVNVKDAAVSERAVNAVGVTGGNDGEFSRPPGGPVSAIADAFTTFDVAVNETVQFGALQVTPRVCYTRPPTETPQTDSFVEVDEVTLQGEVKRIFTGWMFAASPGLHGVEHPIYDVWLTDCKGGASPVAETPPPPAPAHTATKPPPRPRKPAPAPRAQAPR